MPFSVKKLFFIAETIDFSGPYSKIFVLSCTEQNSLGPSNEKQN